jgi:hypothetical protein
VAIAACNAANASLTISAGDFGDTGASGTKILQLNNTFTGSNDFSTICPTTEIAAASAYQITNLDTVISAIRSIAPSILPLDNTFTGLNTFNNNITPITISNTPDTTKKIELTVDNIIFTDPGHIQSTSLQEGNGAFSINSVIARESCSIVLDPSITRTTIKAGNNNLNGEININLDHPLYSEINITAGQINIVPTYGNVNVGGSLGCATLSFTANIIELKLVILN